MRYSWEFDPETGEWRHLPHYAELWVPILFQNKSIYEIKQSRNPKDPWRKIDLVIIRTNEILIFLETSSKEKSTKAYKDLKPKVRTKKTSTSARRIASAE